MNTDNLFRFNPLLLRLHVQKISTRNITNIRNGWDWEAAKRPPRPSVIKSSSQGCRPG